MHVRVSALASLIMQVDFADEQGSQADNVHGLLLMSHTTTLVKLLVKRLQCPLLPHVRLVDFYRGITVLLF